MATLFGTASFSVLFSVLEAHSAQAPVPPPAAPVEDILVTGSLIRGTEAVGVPVTTLNAQDFLSSGVITVADLLKNVPSVFIQASNTPAVQGGNQTRTATLDIHKLGGSRTLMLIDGMRYPLQKQIASGYDPSIIPALALDRIDVLPDGASATYGSDAVSGVVNVILRRGFDGAVIQTRIGTAHKSDFNSQLGLLFGRAWDSGDVTVSYENWQTDGLDGWMRDFFTSDFTPWGLDNQISIRSSIPGIVSTGAPSSTTGTSCTNCYSIPKGAGWNYGDTAAHTNPTAPGSAPTTTWAALLANQGVAQNQINPYSIAQATNSQQRNAATITFDQEIYPGIEVFGEGFYSNRRVQLNAPANTTPYDAQTLFPGLTVPTINPYYPTGAPAGLRISYNFARELQPRNIAYELSTRYAGGLNFELPYEWQGKVFGAVAQENNLFNEGNSPNINNVNAALGNTVASTASAGSTPGTVAYTKPANVPFLNVFCDPTGFQCNSQATIDYINAYGITQSTYIVHQYGANFDGPLFALPGGEVRAALGAAYSTDKYYFATIRTRNSPTAAMVLTVPDYNSRNQWAVFGQLNAPLVGDDNALPFVHRLDVEFSYRYDHYSDFGGTSNPKVALDWELIAGLTFRGSYGTSFRAPQLTNISPVAARSLSGVNIIGGANNNTQPACATVGGVLTPTPGTAGALLNPTCDPSAALNFPAGISIQGGTTGLQGVSRPDNYALAPEVGKNLNLGFQFAPNGLLGGLFDGLDISLTWYRTHLSNTITTLTLNNVGNALVNPTYQQTLIVAGQPGFAQALAGVLAMPQSVAIPASAIANVKWIQDGAARNAGTLKQEGFDVSAEYTVDLGNLGTWNTGLDGSYVDHQISQAPGGLPVDTYDTNGQPLAFRWRYRSHLGWEQDGLSVTGFMNYTSHVSHTGAFPPASFLAKFPNYSNEVPAQFLFDLTLGYNTQESLANTYLHNINVQLVVNNILNRDPPFAYAGGVAYLAPLYSPFGRTMSLTLTKTW